MIDVPFPLYMASCVPPGSNCLKYGSALVKLYDCIFLIFPSIVGQNLALQGTSSVMSEK